MWPVKPDKSVPCLIWPVFAWSKKMVGPKFRNEQNFGQSPEVKNRVHFIIMKSFELSRTQIRLSSSGFTEIKAMKFLSER